MNFDGNDLHIDIAAVTEGEPHGAVVRAFTLLLGQVVADTADTVEVAQQHVEVICAAIKADIAVNWHLIAARRQRQ